MIADNLFERVLLDPIGEADRLHVVSGYASASFAKHHLTEAKPRGDISVELVVGMAAQDGITEDDHTGFRQMEEGLGDRFRCAYFVQHPPAHTKMYVWSREGRPVVAWVGSANYTHPGFVGTRQQNVMGPVEAGEALDYFKAVREQSLGCRDARTETRIKVRQSLPANTSSLPCVELPLTDRKGEVPARSGLNWGQRPNRDPNQAYLPVPGHVARSGFFPPRKQNFALETDDFESFVCAIAQDESKAIHSTFDNADLGRYFRRRLSVPSGAPVTKDHLVAYGRDSVTIRKLDESVYLLDFSVPSLPV